MLVIIEIELLLSVNLLAQTLVFLMETFLLHLIQLAYTKKPEERSFRGVITLEECILEDGPEVVVAEEANGKSSKSKSSSNGATEKEDPTASLIFRVSHKVAYKTVLKGNISFLSNCFMA